MINFDYGSKLANFQDKKFKEYCDNKKISKKDLATLKDNVWVKLAENLAPGNLVIRHLCLIDLFEDNNKNVDEIKAQLDIIGADIWREGYSYWLYTKPFLVAYSAKFGWFNEYIKEMDKKFAKTAYIGKDSLVYPAPFGDIRHVFLENSADTTLIEDNINLFPIEKKTISSNEIIYQIKECPVGMNTHIPKENQTIVVKNGMVFISKNEILVDFIWYDGYDKKYDNIYKKILDTFSLKRIFSLF